MKINIVVALALFALTACNDKPEYSVIGAQGKMKAIGIPAERVEDQEHYQRIIDAECPQDGFCILSFFVGLSSVSYPLSDTTLTAQTAQYNRNPNSGMDRLLLACRLGDIPADECF